VLVTLVELLLLLERTVQDGEPADVVDKVLVAHSVLLIVANRMLNRCDLTLAQSPRKCAVNSWVLAHAVVLHLGQSEPARDRFLHAQYP
jgi:hypothetical protein